MNDINNSKEAKKGLFNYLSPKKSFLLGAATIILVGLSIGFFILLFSENSSFSSSINANKSFAGSDVNSKNPSQRTGSANNNPGKKIAIAPVTSDDHINGDINKAGVVIVEFSDLECPFCKRFHSTMKQVVDEYGDQVAWVYRHFPLDSLHPKSRKEAEASECASELGGNKAFWAYVDKLFEVTPSNNGLDSSQLPIIAKDIGLDTAKFQKCLDSGKYADKIEKQVKDATSSGGTGTPYSVAISKNGQMVPISGAQPFSSVKNIIDPML